MKRRPASGGEQRREALSLPELDSYLYRDAVAAFLDQFELSFEVCVDLAADKEKLAELSHWAKHPQEAPGWARVCEGAKDMVWWEITVRREYFEELDRTDPCNEDDCRRIKQEYHEWKALKAD